MESLVTWITTHALGLIVGIVVLILIYRFARPMIHRIVLAVLRAQQGAIDGGGATADEVRKRADTLEDLLTRVIRVAVFAVLIALLLSTFDLWGMVAGLGLILAALTIAGQSIILDYLMGILILVEGQYFNGDWISINDPGSGVMIEGEVEEVGLRRTTLRDMAGVQHSISNGSIRISSNWTRVYAVASISVHVLRGSDLGHALEIVESVSKELMADPAWKDRILEAPHMTTISDMTARSYLTATAQAITGAHVAIGLVKSPFLALAIALVACGEGLATQGGAAAVGSRTTAAVVIAIFSVIVINALFTLLFVLIGV